MKNISELSHCYGCSLCAVICPQQIITLCQDKEGFYQPVIEKNDECTACGLCSKVCAFINDENGRMKILGLLLLGAENPLFERNLPQAVQVLR